jgi:hypothetical protein
LHTAYNRLSKVEVTMYTFDIFESSDSKNDALWLECIEGLDAARDRMYEIAAQRPGMYYVLNLQARLLVAKTDTRSLDIEDSDHRNIVA